MAIRAQSGNNVELGNGWLSSFDEDDACSREEMLLLSTLEAVQCQIGPHQWILIADDHSYRPL